MFVGSCVSCLCVSHLNLFTLFSFWLGKKVKGPPIKIPTEGEWEVLEQLKVVLEPFKHAQHVLEGQKGVTSSLVLFVLNCIHQDLVQLTQVNGDELNSDVSDLADTMLTRFETIFGSINCSFLSKIKQGKGRRQVGLNKALVFAHALDPRFKLLTKVDAVQNK